MLHSPPTVYLDTQDYSRFGTVIEGRGSAETEGLYKQLVALADAGDATFACSMPIMSELLSYNDNLPGISDAKAQAVEALCQGHALKHPSRVVAIEMARVAYDQELVSVAPEERPHSNDYAWYPDIEDVFANLHDRIRAMKDEHINRASRLNRAARRMAQKQMRSFDPMTIVNEAAPEVAARFGFSEADAHASLGEFLQGRISSREGSRRMFATIARPTTFVQAYFLANDGDKSLPAWISGFGEQIAGALAKFQNMFAALPPLDDASRSSIKSLIARQASGFSTTFLNLAKDELPKLTMPTDLFEKMSRDTALVNKVPSASNAGKLLSSYIAQTVGLVGSASKVERSFGGDLMHAVYLPHVDLWRADRRFAHLAKLAVPGFKNKVVTRCTELPGAIEHLLRADKERHQ